MDPKDWGNFIVGWIILGSLVFSFVYFKEGTDGL